MTARATPDTRWSADFGPIRHQPGGLVQGEIEAWGIPTISLSDNPGTTGRVMPARWAHVRFPRGSMLNEGLNS